MATLAPRSFTAIVQMIAAGVQGRAKVVLDFSIGSVLRSVAEGHAGVALWLQGLILKLLLTTRAATSSAGDLDTWMADFGLYRLGATPASGRVVFSRFTPSAATPFIPVGATVETADGSQSFVVQADVGSPLFSSSLNGFTLPAYVASISVPVKASNSGYATNALAGAVTTLTTSIPGIDTVVNPTAFTGGVDAESDQAFRLRFQQFIASLSKGTVAAIKYAVASLQFGAQCTVVENFNYDGSARNGFFYAVVDDGSGTPSTALLNAAGLAIEAVRPFTVNFAVFPPVIIPVDVTMTVASAAGFDHNVVIGNVGDAILKYVNAMPLGVTLSYTRLMQVAFNADPGVVDITGYRLNNSLGDVTCTPKNVVKINSVTVL